jgi:hypothetical protein
LTPVRMTNGRPHRRRKAARHLGVSMSQVAGSARGRITPDAGRSCSNNSECPTLSLSYSPCFAGFQMENQSSSKAPITYWLSESLGCAGVFCSVLPVETFFGYHRAFGAALHQHFPRHALPLFHVHASFPVGVLVLVRPFYRAGFSPCVYIRLHYYWHSESSKLEFINEGDRSACNATVSR